MGRVLVDASLLGSPGQAAYACASAWLEAWSTWRRASGLPATAINWGQWSDIGVARLVAVRLDSDHSGRRHRGSGGGAGRRPRPDRCGPAAAGPRAGRVPGDPQLGYFAHLAEELDTTATTTTGPGPDALRELDAVEANRTVTDVWADASWPSWATRRSTVDPAVPLTELGMDSLMAVRIRNTVRADFGVEPPVALLLQGASL